MVHHAPGTTINGWGPAPAGVWTVAAMRVPSRMTTVVRDTDAAPPSNEAVPTARPPPDSAADTTLP
ncbi:hypothetical protein GCM10018785_34960 [Streptomyces longispororuber]|uniref:Uncharacterized protein n=1 Tax=Streptomyces longispororuber TaxID=68230 RepID=A0A918ZP18_9ACTN|nr:hypothetical protein GCM10018785_34960 [Streptomyces longispororuber]